MSALATEWKDIIPSERDESASGVTIEDFDITDLMAFDSANDPTNLLGNRWGCGGCTILYNVGNHTLAELLDFPTMDDPPEVAAEKQRRLLEMTPAKNAPVSA